MAKPERVLRLTGSYFRTEGLSEEEFYNFMSRRHGVECAKIHEKYGILKYQMVGARALLPYTQRLPSYSSRAKLPLTHDRRRSTQPVPVPSSRA